jgi:hypothetical protein
VQRTPSRSTHDVDAGQIRTLPAIDRIGDQRGNGLVCGDLNRPVRATRCGRGRRRYAGGSFGSAFCSRSSPSVCNSSHLCRLLRRSRLRRRMSSPSSCACTRFAWAATSHRSNPKRLRRTGLTGPVIMPVRVVFCTATQARFRCPRAPSSRSPSGSRRSRFRHKRPLRSWLVRPPLPVPVPLRKKRKPPSLHRRS